MNRKEEIEAENASPVYEMIRNEDEIPTMYFFNNSLLAARISNLVVRKNGTARVVVQPLEDKRVFTIANLTIEAASSPKDVVEILQQDMSIIDAIGSFLEMGRMEFTVDDVCRFLSVNYDRSIKESERKIELVRNRIDALRFVEVEIDMTAEAIGRHLMSEKDGRWILSEYMIPAISLKNRVGSDDGDYVDDPKKQAYRILKMPPTYEYGKTIGQVIQVPLEKMKIEGPLNDTGEEDIIKRYCFRKLAMATKREREAEIRYETKNGKIGMFEELKLDRRSYFSRGLKESAVAWSKRKARLHKITVQVLDSFVKNGLIDGYVIIKNGRSYVGVSLKPKAARR